MPPQQGKKKKRRLKVKPVRNKQGQFKKWPGGDSAKQNGYSHHGTMVHIGKEFVRQNNRVAKVGDSVRTKTKDGTYNKNAPWYIKTQHGWRKTAYSNKPTKNQTKETLDKSRPGR